jgi:hypothetical protein
MHIPSYWQILVHEYHPASTSAFRYVALSSSLLAILEAPVQQIRKKRRQKRKGMNIEKASTAEIGEARGTPTPQLMCRGQILKCHDQQAANDWGR